MNKRVINYWFISSFVVSLFVAIPILTVFSSFFSSTSAYMELLKATFLKDYIVNSSIILIGVLILTFFFGVVSAYFVSFYNFWGVNFFKWALILSFAVPAYIYAYSLTAFFENYSWQTFRGKAAQNNLCRRGRGPRRMRLHRRLLELLIHYLICISLPLLPCSTSESESSSVSKSKVVSANAPRNTAYAWNISMKIARQLDSHLCCTMICRVAPSNTKGC